MINNQCNLNEIPEEEKGEQTIFRELFDWQINK